MACLLYSRLPAGAGLARHICSHLAFAHVLAESTGTNSAHHFRASTDDFYVLPHLRDRPAGVHQSAWPAGLIRDSAAPGGGVAAIPADAVLCRPAGGGSRSTRRVGLGEDPAPRRASRARP